MKKLQPLIEGFEDLDPEELIKIIKNNSKTMIEIPLTPTFKKKYDALLKKKDAEGEDKIYLSEVFVVSREAALED
jgi:hypothetical protein